jgi:tRNA/tmRNA/rRNA uracil-C5-methylase (TrmA/RlmC/RlmD family)
MIEIDVGPVAHGGHCVSRVDGRVVFVRHALPGERVRAVVTEERSSFLRADAVEILSAAPDRVEPPCPYARPGRCGGCDFQHATPAAQLRLKAAVVREQLARLAGLPDFPVRAEPLPANRAGRGPEAASEPASSGGPLGWRTRVQYAVDDAGTVGLRKFRSHEIVPIDRCRIAHPEIQALPVTSTQWPPGSSVEVIRSSLDETPTVLVRQSRRSSVVSGVAEVSEWAVGRRWTFPATVFWQVHPAAADTFAGAVLDLLAPEPGERVWDLYGGVGLFAAVLADAVGAEGRVTVVESDGDAVAAGRRNLFDLRQVRFVRADVAQALANPHLRSADIVVLDPPRSGAGRRVVELLVRAAPRAIAYVACDPASLARDVRTFGELGYRLVEARAYDAFPMTHHVEVIALLVRNRGEVSR